jgi:hypothetical protein
LRRLHVGEKIKPMRRAKPRSQVLFALATTVVVLAATVASAQIWVGGRGGGRGARPKWATIQDFDGSFVYCRGFFTSWYREAGGSGWSTDYPGSDNNFSVRFAELTRVHVKLNANREPNYVVVSLTDPLLYRCPILLMEDVGTAEFSDAEVAALRSYFLKGGFLWVDDFWGSYAWDNWVTQISRVLPPGSFPIVDLSNDHPMMRMLYDVKEVPQVPNIGFWRQTGGGTSERFEDSAKVHFRGIADDRGRLMVLMTHNTDIADTWEREGENQDYFHTFSPRGYALGVNVMLYAMSH